jgi:aldose sugar dehydrogenase
MRFATIAPSSIDFYNVNSGLGIPGWYPSLLVPTLRRGTLYRYKLNATMDSVITDSIPYFHTNNRYRDIALSPDGKKIYLVTDSIGSTSGPSGSGTSALDNRGAIMEFTFTGVDLLEQNDPYRRQYVQRQYRVNVYPNPATQYITVQFEKGLHKPIYYKLTDVSGRLVLEDRTTKDQFNIMVDHLPKGMYMLKLYNGYRIEVKTEKIVIQ